MFIDDIKRYIRNNPQIVMVTNRGLETKDRKVVFVARNLDTRYPELKKLFNQDVISKPKILDKTNINISEETKTTKKKIKKK